MDECEACILMRRAGLKECREHELEKEVLRLQNMVEQLQMQLKYIKAVNCNCSIVCDCYDTLS